MTTPGMPLAPPRAAATCGTPVAGDAPELRMIWLELTGKCQLECTHCYAGSGPQGSHGTMTAEDWEVVLTDAAGLGAHLACFIGGEPTLHPDLSRLVRRALALGMEAEVYSNLVSLTPQLWELLTTPGVRLATSWYSDNRAGHQQVTGRDTWRQTLANIGEATRRGIPLRVGLVDGIVPGQRAEAGAELLRAHGVTSIGTDRLREFGRGTVRDPSQACGGCGHRRLAVLPDGAVTPCPLTRWLEAGNVTTRPLADILAGVTDLAATLTRLNGTRTPSRCDPDAEPGPCMPENCNPERGAAAAVQQVSADEDCMPDYYCPPNCNPGACKPRI